jgi:ribulose kinase
VVALDEQGWPIRPAIMWMDERATDEANAITATGSPVLRYSGSVVSPQWMLPKLKWLMNHEPSTYAQAYRIVEQTDFFTYRLSGRWTLGYGNLVAKWNYANPVGGWPPGFLRSIGLDAANQKWPESILPVATCIGPLRTDVAAATGLSPRMLVVQGGVDSHAGMVGAGAVEDGDVGLVLGTSTVLHAQSNEAIFADIWGPYPDALISGRYVIGGGQTTSGSVIQWALRAFCADLQTLEREAGTVPPGSDGLVALDYFQGNRTPRKDPRARGAIWGLTLSHTPAQMLRAFHEANAFGTRHILENLADHGFHPRRVSAGGGGARSTIGVQILADVCGHPIRLVDEVETTAVGAAIWAGLGTGLFPDYTTAVQRMVHVRHVVDPTDDNRAIYDFYFDKYLRTYEGLRDLMHEVADFEVDANRKSSLG